MLKQLLPEAIEPETYPNSSVFVNLLGITDSRQLATKEADFTFVRGVELLSKDCPIQKTYDFDHLKRIHRYLFQDLYSWAGMPRSYDISKGGDIFTPANELIKYQHDAFKSAQELYTNSQGLDLEDVVKLLAASIGIINAYHPFPEGNGRTQRIFISQLATEVGYKADWKVVGAWHIVSALKQSHSGNYEPLEEMMGRIISK